MQHNLKFYLMLHALVFFFDYYTYVCDINSLKALFSLLYLFIVNALLAPLITMS